MSRVNAFLRSTPALLDLLFMVVLFTILYAE